MANLFNKMFGKKQPVQQPAQKPDGVFSFEQHGERFLYCSKKIHTLRPVKCQFLFARARDERNGKQNQKIRNHQKQKRFLRFVIQPD